MLRGRGRGYRLELPADQMEVEPDVRVVIRPANGLPLIANHLGSAKRDTGGRTPTHVSVTAQE